MAALLNYLLAACLVLVGAVYAYFKHRFSYWKKKGVPHDNPVIPFGTVQEIILGQKSQGLVYKDAYDRYPGERYVGSYTFVQPVLVLRDPDLIRHVLLKDFELFNDRGIPYNDHEPLNHTLFLLAGPRWKRLRTKMTPTFSSAKLKMMFQTMQECGREMVEVLLEECPKDKEYELREIAARYTTEVIASVGFGVRCGCQRNPDAEFRQWSRKVFQPSLRLKIGRLMFSLIPPLGKLLSMKTNLSEVSAYFRGMVADTVKYREENNVFRNDFMQLLVQLKNKGFVEGAKSQDEMDNWKLNINEVAAQAYIFFAAGFETSSTTMSFALHELALQPDIQKKVIDEIDETLRSSGGDFTYENIQHMEYLDKVISETLRKHPPAAFLSRKNHAPYQVPDSDLVIDKGTFVVVPAQGIHHDPQYYPDPDRFDPERFSEEEKAKRPPYTYLPFGEGPRYCLGKRLGLQQTKLGLAYLLSRFEVRPCSMTQAKLKYDPTTFVLAPVGGIYLRLIRRDNWQLRIEPQHSNSEQTVK